MYCVLWLFLRLSYKFGCILEIVLRKHKKKIALLKLIAMYNVKEILL